MGPRLFISTPLKGMFEVRGSHSLRSSMTAIIFIEVFGAFGTIVIKPHCIPLGMEVPCITL